MNKIINIILLGVIGLIGGLFLSIVWLVGIVFILVNEIIGTRKFMMKFNKLNNIIAEEFKDILNVFKSLDRVK